MVPNFAPFRQKALGDRNRTRCYGLTVLLPTEGRDAEHGGGQGQLQGPGTCPMGHVCVKKARADRGRVTKS
jgi:hypothetical protein